MRDPRILILDDALSAVDTYTEEEILKRLRTVMKEPHEHHHQPPDLDGEGRGPDRRAQRGRDRRTRDARGTRGARAASMRSCTRSSYWKKNSNTFRTASGIVAMHEEEILGKAYDGRLMKRLLTYLRPYRWHVALGIVLSIVVSAIEAVRPWFTKHRGGREHRAGGRARAAHDDPRCSSPC